MYKSNHISPSKQTQTMKIVLLAIGKTSSKYLQEGVSEYLKRLSFYIPVELRILADVKTSKALTENKQKEMEGEIFLNNIRAGDFVVLLDEKGKEMTSREFSSYIEKKMTILPKRLIFIIGGPYGFAKSLYDRANDKLSLSKMTFSHEMVRLFFMEQLYRAMTIIKGEPYHHD